MSNFNHPTAGTMFTGGGPPQVNTFNMGGVNPLLGMAAQLGVQQIAAPSGIVPLQFSPQASTFDQLQSLQLQAQNQQAMQQSVKIDQQSMQELIQGLHVLMGDNSQEARDRASVLASDYATIAPYLAQFSPRAVSMLGGEQGSAMVASQQMMLAGRHMVDPVTGQLGFSADTAATFSQIATEQLYGSREAQAAMRGVPVDRMAEILAVSSRRGMGPSSITTDGGAMAAMEMFQTGRVTEDGTAAAREMELSDADIEALQGGGQGAEQVVRKLDAQRTARWMQEMAGAVRAMEDIFGPGMPGDQLITAMMQLTQNNAAGMTPAELEMSLRTTKQLAEASDLGIGGMMQLQAHAGQLGDQLGLGRENAITAAQHAAAFSMAFDQQGLGEFGFNKDRFTAADTQLMQQAGASPVAEQLAATVRLGDMAPFETDTTAEALYTALKDGRTTFVDPNTGEEKSVYLSEQEWTEVMAAGGVGEQTAMQVRLQQGLNRETAEKQGLDDITRSLQFDLDVAPRLSAAADNAIFAQLSEQGVDLDRQATERIGQRITDTIDELSMEDLTDVTARRDAVAADLRGALEAEGVKLDDISDEQLTRMAGAVIGEIDVTAREMGHKDLEEAFALHDDAMLGATRQQIGREQLDADLGRALSGLGQTDFGRRLVETVKNASPDDTLETVIGKAFGGVEQAEMVEALEPMFEDLTRQKAELQEVINNPAAFDPETGRLKAEEQERVDHMLGRINELVQGSDMTGRIAGDLIALQGHEGEHAFTDFLTDTEGAPAALDDEQRAAAGVMLQRAAQELQTRGREGMVERMAERMGVSTEELIGDEPLDAAVLSDEVVENETRMLAGRKMGLGAVRRMAEDEYFKQQAATDDEQMDRMLEEAGVAPPAAPPAAVDAPQPIPPQPLPDEEPAPEPQVAEEVPEAQAAAAALGGDAQREVMAQEAQQAVGGDAYFQRLMEMAPAERFRVINPTGKSIEDMSLGEKAKVAGNIKRIAGRYSTEQLSALLGDVEPEQLDALEAGVVDNPQSLFNPAGFSPAITDKITDAVEAVRTEEEPAPQEQAAVQAVADDIVIGEGVGEQAAALAASIGVEGAGPPGNMENMFAAAEGERQARTPDERDRSEDLEGHEQTLKIAGTLEIPGLGEGHIKATSGQAGFMPVT